MPNTEIVAIPALIISLLAFGLSIYVDHKNRKQNKENAMSIFFKDLFFDIIVKELPKELLKFNSEDNIRKIEILDNIDMILVNILDNAIFYKYYDNNFYDKLKNNIMELQDECFKVSNLIDKGKYRIDNNNIERMLACLYSTMINYYSSI